MSYPISQELPVDSLRPSTFNTNFVSPDNEAKLDAAIRKYGMFKPIIVRETETGFEIIGGEHRWLSSKRLGFTKIAVMNLGPIDDERAKEISLADNARYGADDASALAELLNGLSDLEHLSEVLPFSDNDIRAIFSSVDISIDDLELEDSFEAKETPDEPKVAAAPKTHTIMRFKISLEDAERVTALITKTKKEQDFTSGDDLTNAGDALVHLLLTATDA